MPQTVTSNLAQIHALLASRRYAVTEIGEDVLQIQETDSGVSLQAALQGDILFLSVVCGVAPEKAITAQLMRKMLSGENGIATSHFKLHRASGGQIAVTLNNFCKLQELGPDDEDDILSCVGFLLADVLHARDLIGAELESK